MGVWGKIILIIGIVIVALFLLTFLIFIFNLDMKLAAGAYSFLQKHHNKKDAERKSKF